MRKFRNFHVAEKYGYTEIVSPYVPGMGTHVTNLNYIDGEFDLLKPEILVYYEDKHGRMILGAAEYLYVIPDCSDLTVYPDAPEGFIGTDDKWHVNCNAGPGGWTLHAWVGLENPDGVFAPYNPVLP